MTCIAQGNSKFFVVIIHFLHARKYKKVVVSTSKANIEDCLKLPKNTSAITNLLMYDCGKTPSFNLLSE